MAFRLTINDEGHNKNHLKLGDRTLCLWVGSGSGGIYAFATYTYTNMNGGGNPNTYKTVPYKEDLKQWHYVYFAYSRKMRKAIGFARFGERTEKIDISNTNHYLS